MTIPLRDLAAAVGADGAITAEDVLALRRTVWADGVVSSDEAAAIFAINNRLASSPREWVDFFVEALSVWLVDEQEPRGYVDEGQARWLIDQIEAGGPSATPAELELLARCLEKAVSVPGSVRSYALDQMEKGALDAGRITSDEVRLLRRVLFATAGDRPAAVSQREAELLFRIKDATLGAENAPEWQQMFVQGVADFLQGFGGFAAPSREREEQLDAFMDKREPGALGLLEESGESLAGNGPKIALPDLRGEHLGYDPDAHHSFGALLLKRLFGDGDDELLGHDLEAASRDAAEVTPEENAWLKTELDADGKLDPLEQALLDFLKTA